MSRDVSQDSDKYVVGSLLGAGGMAEVYRATVRGAEGFTRDIAVKRIRPEFSSSERFVELLVAEARTTSLLNHPNVVSVIDFDRDRNGQLFLAMELVQGRDLRQLIDTGPLPFSLIIHITLEVLRGLGHAHELRVDGRLVGLVHRDVSPHNVLVSWDGAVKVSDFGVAKACVMAAQSGVMRGKPSYMSPEQATLQPLDRRADLFSVGAMMYRMIGGRVPHVGTSPAQVLSKLLHAPTVPIHELRTDVPRDLARVTMRLLERDRERRYANHLEVIEDLVACADAPSRGELQLAELLVRRFPHDAPSAGSDAAADAVATAAVAPPRGRRRLARGSDTKRPVKTALMTSIRPQDAAGGVTALPPLTLDIEHTRSLPPPRSGPRARTDGNLPASSMNDAVPDARRCSVVAIPRYEQPVPAAANLRSSARRWTLVVAITAAAVAIGALAVRFLV